MKPVFFIMIMALSDARTLAETPVQPAARVQSGALELTLALPRSTFHVGEEIDLRFTLRNIGGTIVVLRSFSPRLFDFAVYDADGIQLLAPTFFKKPILAPPAVRVLRPGEALTNAMAWNLAITNHAGHRVQLAPGSYALEGYALSDQLGVALLRTPRLSIVLLP